MTNQPASHINDPHAGQPVVATGEKLRRASAVMILLHGRGATAESILELTPYMEQPRVAYLAPQAAFNTWYPYSFLEPMERNEPYLSSALARVGAVVDQILTTGIPSSHIILGGFSQGACLASEFAARNARRYGGLIAFSGGLIGPPGTPRDYSGAFDGMPVFLGCSDTDPHIPLERVEETAEVLARMGAEVDKRIYPRMGHTVNQDELDAATALLAGVVTSRREA
jgi:predicted esterase